MTRETRRRMSETESAQGIAEGYRRARVIEEREGGKYAAFAWFQHGDSCRRVAENWVSHGLEGTSGVGTYLPTSESLCLSSLAFEGGAPRVKPMTNYRLCRCGESSGEASIATITASITRETSLKLFGAIAVSRYSLCLLREVAETVSSLLTLRKKRYFKNKK